MNSSSSTAVSSGWTDPITKKKYDNHDEYYLLNSYKYHTSTIRKMILISEVGKYLHSSLENIPPPSTQSLHSGPQIEQLGLLSKLLPKKVSSTMVPQLPHL